MGQEDKRCRQCLLRDTLDEAAYRRTVTRVYEAMNPRVRVTDAQYEERLAACRACEHLQSGTCMRCGCMVEMRAMRKDTHCPPPVSRW